MLQDRRLQRPKPPHVNYRRFNFRSGLEYSAVSAGVLIPCFWHRHLEAGYLGSHVYNAWLAQLIERGQAPGLWIARQWDNVAFDLLLAGLGKAFGLAIAEKIAVSVCVLIFFWGTVALVRAASGRMPWSLMPFIAMISYGWTFNNGFFNYYLSAGLSFFALAILWRAPGLQRLAAFAFAPLIWLAQPVGLLWLVCAGIYILLAKIVPRRFHILLFAAATASVVLAMHYFRRHFVTYGPRHAPYLFNGIDQFVLFSARYKILAVALLAFIVVAAAIEVRGRRRDPELWHSSGVLLQLYIIVQAAVLTAPFAVRFARYGAPIDFLPDQLTLLSAVLICCLLGVLSPRKWRTAGYAVAAAVYFAFLFTDTAVLNRMEEQAEQLVATLPPGQRVLYTINSRGSRVLIEYIVDRACVGHCFSYENYEPGSRQFRVRAAPGNSFVATDSEQIARMEDGVYEVRQSDLPIFQIYQCSETGRDLCIRPLAPGERNDRLGVRQSPFQAHR